MTITGPDPRSGVPGQAVVDAALLLLAGPCCQQTGCAATLQVKNYAPCRGAAPHSYGRSRSRCSGWPVSDRLDVLGVPLTYTASVECIVLANLLYRTLWTNYWC